MVAWPEGVHHVLTVPPEQQTVRQGRIKEQANGTVLQTQYGQSSKPEDKEEFDQSQENEEQCNSHHLVVKNHLELFQTDGFWNCFTHPAYSDLDLILQDDRISVNRSTLTFFQLTLALTVFAFRATLAALCPNLSTLFNSANDALILENVCRQVRVAQIFLSLRSDAQC